MMNDFAADDTEWHDALRKYGVIPEKPKIEEEEVDIPTLNEIEEAEKKKKENSDVSDLDSDIEQILDDYCKDRRADLASKVIINSNKRSIIEEVNRENYVREVAEASKRKPVLVLLYDQGKNSKLVEASLDEVSEELYGHVKICKIEAEECIPGYPSRNVPTLILYTDGAAKRNYAGIGQIVTSQKLSCARSIIEELKKVLSI